MRTACLTTILLVACSSGGKTKEPPLDPGHAVVKPDAAPVELPGQNAAALESVEGALPIAKNTTIVNDLPYKKAHYYKFSMTAGETLLVKCTTRISGDEMYPKTVMQVLDAAGKTKLVEWRSSLWDNKSEFTADTAGDYLFRIENAQYEQYPLTIHYTVVLQE